tara:strand:- start:4822 stop:7473 length:2652 start_codon:yes stop_codon:yes gene_type:complete
MIGISKRPTRSVGHIRNWLFAAACGAAASCSGGGVASLGGDEVISTASSFAVLNSGLFHIVGQEGGPFPEGTRTYSIQNTGVNALLYEVELPEPWLGSSSTGGMVLGGNATDLDIWIDQDVASALAPGDYPADIKIRDRNDATGGLEEVVFLALMLTISPEDDADLSIANPIWSIDAVDASDLAGANHTFTVANEGGGDLDFNVTTSGEDWLLITSLGSSTVAADDSTSVVVQLDATALSSLPDGTHESTLTFTNADVATDTQDVIVSVTLGDSSSDRVQDGLVALYEFEEATGGTVYDSSGLTPAMDLTIEDQGSVAWQPGTLTLNSATRLVTSGPATRINNAISSSNELTVEAWIDPANVSQSGPARVVTISDGAYDRNFTLGQGLWGTQPADTFSMRLRSTSTDGDGLPHLATGAGGAVNGLMHVVFTRSTDGETVLYVNDVPVETGSTGGTLAGWDSSFKLALGNEIGESRPWFGKYHLVSIYDRALPADQVHQNFLAGTGDAPVGYLQVTPGTDFAVNGMEGTDLSPSDMTYVLTNPGGEPVQWAVSIDEAWAFTNDATSGTLQGSSSASIKIELDLTQVNNLVAGNYTANIDFTSDGIELGEPDRQVIVNIAPEGGGGSNGQLGERPGPDNTGPTNPSILVPSGSITVTQDNTVIENVDIYGSISVQANNVTIRNFRLNGGNTYYGIRVFSGYTGCVIEDGEITNCQSSGIYQQNWTARRLEIHHMGADGTKAMGNNLIEGCWMHHLGMNPGSHADGNQSRIGSNIMIRGNYFDMPIPDGPNGPGEPFASNAASINQAQLGSIDNLVMDGNWLNGGNYTVYFSTSDTSNTVTNCKLINNRFMRDYRYGVLTVSGNINDLIISGNVWDDTGELMSIND